MVTGAAELRVKESDRLAVMAEGLTTLGIDCELLPDGLRIQGGQMRGGRIDSHGDHRIAMAFAVASLVAQRAASRSTTSPTWRPRFPAFRQLARSVGLALEDRESDAVGQRRW